MKHIFPWLGCLLMLLALCSFGCGVLEGKLSRIHPGMPLQEVKDLIGEPEKSWDLESPRGTMLQFQLCASADVIGENYFVEIDDDEKVVWSGHNPPE